MRSGGSHVDLFSVGSSGSPPARPAAEDLERKVTISDLAESRPLEAGTLETVCLSETT